MVSLRTRLAAIPMNRLILFLDFDGTLTPIVARPNLARLSRPVRETLRKLVGLLPVVVISGRAPRDLRPLRPADLKPRNQRIVATIHVP